jgi:hypothetical protein
MQQHVDDLDARLAEALRTGDDAPLRTALTAASGLPGPRLNLALVWAFAEVIGETVERPDPPVDEVEHLLDGWAAMSPYDAPADEPAVILPCAAVAAYGEVGGRRPDWWGDEVGKLRRAASDARWRVREVVAQALQRLLAVDWARAIAELRTWAVADDPLVVRAAAAAVAEPPLLREQAHARDAHEVQRQAVGRFAAVATSGRRDDDVRVLRKGLGYAVGVTTAATADFDLLREMASSGDSDLVWIVRANLRQRRLHAWPDEVERLTSLLG